jgi:hypothetical protein
VVRRHVLLTAAGYGAVATWVAPRQGYDRMTFRRVGLRSGRARAGLAARRGLWGLAAALYALAGSLLARAVRR